MILILLLTWVSLAEPVGTVRGEVPDQAGFYKVKLRGNLRPKVGDKVVVQRKGEKVGEATVTKVRKGRCMISPVGGYPVLIGDEVICELSAGGREIQPGSRR